MAGIEKDAVDLIIVATATPDRVAPSTACLAQFKMGITNGCPAFDLAAVCSGFLYAMTVGCQFIRTGMYRNVLIIGADTFSRITDWSRRDCVFFGDGAGAVVLQAVQHHEGLFSSVLYADGRGHEGFTVPPGEKYFTMNARAVYETGSTVLTAAIREVVEKNGLQLSDVTAFVPHQPSTRLLRRTAELLGVPFDRFHTNMSRYANTSGATIPLLLDEVHRGGHLKPGDLVVFAAVGSGWTWGASLYRWI
jgi:3-oxoacyl-[acyl-carrier-protein] synthase-3